MPDVGPALKETGGIPAADMRQHYRRILEEHVVEAWFPRCIDLEYGGFLCDFDRRWRNAGANDKLLEFQARQTLTAAELLMVFPKNPSLRQAVSTGLAFLRDALWDAEYGGWRLRTDRSGAPYPFDAKHAHGMAYAFQACFAVYAATGDPTALELGLKGFEWIDLHARDAVHGGYFGPLGRDGSRVAPGATNSVDFIGTPIGLKDMNVNKDLVDSLSYASAVFPQSAVLRTRTQELVAILVGCFAEPEERPWFFFHPDWTPASGYWKPSEAVHAASLLVEARSFSPDPEAVVDTAARLVRQSFRFGRNRRSGALVLECDAGPEINARQQRITPWWAQFELLKAAEYLHALRPGDAEMEAIGDAARAGVRLFIDEKHGGVTKLPLAQVRLRDRLLRRRRWRDAGSKGAPWKDASHEGRTLLRLASMASEPPHGGPPARGTPFGRM